MGRKQLTETQSRFKNTITEAIEDIKWDSGSDWLKFHFQFPTEDTFHVDIIEDECNHLHIRGQFDDGEVLCYDKISSRVTKSLFEVVMSFLLENF